ncbi:MAG: hypothetical protein PHE50_01130 [Dehalococcoidales bacterium]|nr:hypothetical protein [Dehalococcoidales bacterium]
MKIALVFLTGILAGAIIGLFVFIPRNASAAESDTTETIMPDVETMYKSAFVAPFIKAQDKIVDPDIAGYYQYLLDSTGLTEMADATATPVVTPP